MLIINADDWGRSRAETDAALTCCSAGRVTTVSAMVFMQDADRAAELALTRNIVTGLHLNLSEAFTESVPSQLRQHHERLCRFLNASKYSLLMYHPFLCNSFRYVFESQHSEYMRLYGQSPSHINGHRHMHLATNVLLQGLVPAGTKVRPSFSFQAGEKSLFNRAYRFAVNTCLSRRHPIADYFFCLTQQSSESRLVRTINLAKRATVELMTHPVRDAEFKCLLSHEFGDLLSQVKLGTHKELSGGCIRNSQGVETPSFGLKRPV